MEKGDKEFILRVLELFDKYDERHALWWRTDGSHAPITFYLDTSDFLVWGSADCEEITPGNIELLEKSYEECARVDPEDCTECYGNLLFCCRVNTMRPQGVCYPDNKALWPLLDACGPEREIGLGNPYPPGERDRIMPKKPSTTLFCENPATPEGKYLIKRRDGTIPGWPSFVLAAPDPVAEVALRAYADEVRRLVAQEPEEARKLGFTLEFTDSLSRRADQFRQYRIDHGDSDPGMGPHRKDGPATIAEMRQGQSS